MKKVYKTKSKLYEIEKMSTNFMRISKNCIVNIEHIKNFDISKTGSIIINLDDKNITVISSAIVIKIRNAHDNNISRPPS